MFEHHTLLTNLPLPLLIHAAPIFLNLMQVSRATKYIPFARGLFLRKKRFQTFSKGQQSQTHKTNYLKFPSQTAHAFSTDSCVDLRWGGGVRAEPQGSLSSVGNTHTVGRPRTQSAVLSEAVHTHRDSVGRAQARSCVQPGRAGRGHDIPPRGQAVSCAGWSRWPR